MTWNRVMVDLVELREAASVLHAQAGGLLDTATRLPTELPEAPAQVAAPICEALCQVQAELTALGDELEVQASSLDTRIDQVETAEARWWEIGPGGVSSGCCLPSGEMVTLSAPATATSSASGPGVAAPTMVGNSAGSGTSGLTEALGAGSSIGGGGPGFTIVGPDGTPNPGLFEQLNPGGVAIVGPPTNPDPLINLMEAAARTGNIGAMGQVQSIIDIQNNMNEIWLRPDWMTENIRVGRDPYDWWGVDEVERRRGY